MDFKKAWDLFGTRRLMVQIRSPRPLCLVLMCVLSESAVVTPVPLLLTKQMRYPGVLRSSEFNIVAGRIAP